jgi:hypothetical protein
VAAGSGRPEHRIEHVAGAANRFALPAKMERLTFDADDHRDQRLERADVTIVMAVKAQMVVQTVERKRRFDGDTV